MKFLIFIAALAVSNLGYTDDKGIDWGTCKVDLESTGCSKQHDDHEKHECLEHKGKDVVSKDCWAHNQGLEGKFKDKHTKGKPHKH